MASASSPRHRSLGLFFPFRVCVSKPAQFEKCFKVKSAEAKTNLTLASQSRDRLIDQLNRSREALFMPDPVIAAVKGYLPHLASIMQQLTSVDPVMRKNLELKWTSLLSSLVDRYYTAHKFPVESIYAHFMLGVAHYSRAAQLELQIGGSSPHFGGWGDDAELKRLHVDITATKTAYAELRTAAGVFDFVCDTLMNRFPLPDPARPPDLFNGAPRAIRELCLANAQELMALMALSSGKSLEMVARLYLGVAKRLTDAQAALGKDLGASYHLLTASFREYFGLRAQLCHARVRRLLARHKFVEGDYGPAIAFMRRAIDHFKDARVPLESSDVVVQIKDVVALELKDTELELAFMIHENETIYFQPIPSSKELVLCTPLVKGEPIPFEEVPAGLDRQFFDLA